MQDDRQQDFFEFDENFREFLEREQAARSRPGRRRLLTVVVVCAVVIAAVATVLGIFRSDDTILVPNPPQTFPIAPPPPVRRPVPEEAAPAADSVRHTATGAVSDAGTGVPDESRKAPDAMAKARKETTTAAAAGDAPQPAAEEPPTGEATGQAPPPPEHPSRREAPLSPATAAGPANEPVPSPATGSPRTAAETPTATPADAAETTASVPQAPGGLPDLTTDIRSGRLQDAARRFARYLRRHPARYSISLEVACQPATVIRAFSEVDAAGKMFILPTKLGERACFAVLWGVYATIGQARAAKASVPPFFTAQTEPRVVGLFRYLGSQ